MVTLLEAPPCEDCGFHMKPHAVDLTGFNEKPLYAITWQCQRGDKCQQGTVPIRISRTREQWEKIVGDLEP
jgi:hypothetical protein